MSFNIKCRYYLNVMATFFYAYITAHKLLSLKVTNITVLKNTTFVIQRTNNNYNKHKNNVQ